MTTAPDVPEAAVDLMAALRASFARVRMVAPDGGTVTVLRSLVTKRIAAGYKLIEEPE